MRTVYFEPAGRLHSSDWDLITRPPEGYQFITSSGTWDHAIAPLLKNDYLYWVFVRTMSIAVPMHLTKALLESRLKRFPKGVSLTYARNHLVFRPQPWIVHAEWVHVFTGFNVYHLYALRRLIERTLASPYCRKIITSSEIARRSFLVNLDCRRFEHKIEVVPQAVSSRQFVKRFDDRVIRLLFVSSGNTPDRVPGAPGWSIHYNFHTKGGKEVLAAFDVLRRRYPNLELVFRSPVPEDVKQRYRDVPNLRILNTHLPYDALEQEFQTSDIFVFPAHHSTYQVLPVAMSYELPVVTTDVMANAEIVADGVTGFLVPSGKGIPYWWGNLIPAGASPLRKQLDRALEALHGDVVDGLVDKVSILIENPELRRRMGRAGRQEVEVGRFSIGRRNERLKRIFDEAIIDCAHVSPQPRGGLI